VHMTNPLRYGGLPECAVAFHRWYPDGDSNPLVLNTGHQKANLRVWFERKDISDGSLGDRAGGRLAQADSGALTEYGVLWSGPLRGELRIEGILSEEQIKALEKTSDKTRLSKNALQRAFLDSLR